MPLPDPQSKVYSVTECAICYEPLLVPNNTNDAFEPSYGIDDVELSCKHHFHESCTLEYAASSPDARQRCVLCRAKVIDSNGRFLVTIRTENGFAGQIDLGGDIDEEAYLEFHPQVRRAQAFLSQMAFCEYEEAEMFLKGEDWGTVNR